MFYTSLKGDDICEEITIDDDSNRHQKNGLKGFKNDLEGSNQVFKSDDDDDDIFLKLLCRK